MALRAPVIQFRRKHRGKLSYVPRIRRQQQSGDPAPIAVTRADISRQHGIRPSSMLLDIVPLDIADLRAGSRQGDLIIEYEGRILKIPDCIIDQASLHADAANLVHSLVIFDRRWKWQFGRVNGHYNRRSESGGLIKSDDPNFQNTAADSEREPRELAKILLSMMGEPEENYDVEALPNETRPEVEWDDDNPARQLETLCEIYGCRVVLQWDNRVVVWPIGERGPVGRLSRVPRIRRQQIVTRLQDPGYPTDLPIIRLATSVDTPEAPDTIVIATSPIVYQWDFQLEAVGEDKDGDIKLIKDLSFAPNNRDDFGGWMDHLDVDSGLILDDADDSVEVLADKTICKWYRIKVPFEFPDAVEDGDVRSPLKVKHLFQILPVLPYRSSTVVQDGVLLQQQAIVYGRWFDGDDNVVADFESLADELTGEEAAIVPGGFSIDTAKGIVKFSRPIVRFNSSDEIRPADLALRCCFNYRLNSGAWRNLLRSRSTNDPKLGTNDLVLKRPELIPNRRAIFKDGKFTAGRTESNTAEITDLADKYIDAIEATFSTQRPAEVVYAGFYPQIEFNGEIRVISFSIDVNNTSSPITTTLYKDQDMAPYGNLGYVELRVADRLRDMEIKGRRSTSLTDRRKFERAQRQ